MKRLLALTLAAALALTSSVMVFADEVTAPAAEAVVEVVNVPFTGKDVQYTIESGYQVGAYPTFANNEALTKAIFNKINDTYFDMVSNESFEYLPSQGVEVFKYTLEETPTAAKIDIVAVKANLVTAKFEDVVVGTYYIDKVSNKEITAAAYAALVAAVAAPAEEAPVIAEGEEGTTEVPAVVEYEKVPLRAQAEALGYTVGWENGAVTITLGEKVATLVTGVNAYVNFAGEVIELEAAPENIDGILYVPASFFVLVLVAE